MDAVIFDFDGVVVDSEPIHLMGFQRVLARAGVEMTEQEYYEKYLGFDDRDCFAAVSHDKGADFTPDQVRRMTADKTLVVKQALAGSARALPGAVELISAIARAGVPLAICSGALRDEIVIASATVGVGDLFDVIVAAEDVRRGKPDPEGYRLSVEGLTRHLGRAVDPARCIVVEDSPAGITAGKAAGAAVLGVTTSYPADALAEADRIVASLADVTPASLDELL
ncbi:MAG: HAD family phosphatase [Phycisphaerae bacterium]|nr:HAD family phosphatase [Phycisphaerae bacterium]